MRVLTKLMMMAALSSVAAGAAGAGPGSEASVAYRNEATKRFEAPSESSVKEMAAQAQAEGSSALATPLIDELAALGLREETVAVRAGGVKLRLRGGLRSALLAEEREGKFVLTCEGAPAAAQGALAPVLADATDAAGTLDGAHAANASNAAGVQP